MDSISRVMLLFTLDSKEKKQINENEVASGIFLTMKQLVKLIEIKEMKEDQVLGGAERELANKLKTNKHNNNEQNEEMHFSNDENYSNNEERVF